MMCLLVAIQVEDGINFAIFEIMKYENKSIQPLCWCDIHANHNSSGDYTQSAVLERIGGILISYVKGNKSQITNESSILQE